MLLPLIAFIALQHFSFLILEMFLWTRPIGLKVFRMSAEKAQITYSLAQNQGLYNGFLAAGLAWSILETNPEFSRSLQYFFLSCVCAAGVIGGLTVNIRIFFIQSLPAIFALILRAMSY